MCVCKTISEHVRIKRRKISSVCCLLTLPIKCIVFFILLQDSTFERKVEVNYGKFYNTSYLKPGSQNYLNQRAKSDSEAKKTPSNQFIRPGKSKDKKEKTKKKTKKIEKKLEMCPKDTDAPA